MNLTPKTAELIKRIMLGGIEYTDPRPNCHIEEVLLVDINEKIQEIKDKYSCQEIWERIFNWVQDSDADLAGYGNGFDRKGKAYLNDLIERYPWYADEILELF